MRYNRRVERDELQKRREIEDRAIELGEERAEIKRQLDANTDRIIELLDSAVERVPLEHLARYLNVGRATLYRWLDEVRGPTQQNP
jgi:transcriptional antiterminator